MSEENAVDQGMVWYSDGGCRPKSRGFGGYGIHGFLYKVTPPKKGIGLSGVMTTDEGYKDKAELESPDVSEEFLDGEMTAAEYKKANAPTFSPVTPLQYFDGMGSLGTDDNPVTNNYAEVMGAMRAFQEAAKFDVKRVVLYSDSEYVIQGLEKNAANWAKAGWVKPDGEPRPNAETWKELLAWRDTLVERGVSIEAKWVRGHNDDVGNERADSYATIGVMHSMAGEQKETLERSPADGYWGYEATRDPLLFQRRIYFNTDTNHFKPGEYFTGSHGKDDEDVGIRTAEACCGIVRLHKPDSVIDAVRVHQAKVCDNVGYVAMIKVDSLFRPDTHRQVSAYGPFATVRPRPYKFDLECTDEEPMTRVFVPPRTSMRVIEALTSLDEKLAWYLAKDPRIVITDMTPILYETVVKTPKSGPPTTHQVLKDIYNVGYAALRLEANYKSVDGTIQAVPITLNLGVDMPDRNALKRMEVNTPVVTLISWEEADYVFRYAVVVETTSGMGIYAGVYSNIRMLERADKPK